MTDLRSFRYAGVALALALSFTACTDGPEQTPPDVTPPVITPPDDSGPKPPVNPDPPDNRNCKLPSTGKCEGDNYHYCDISQDVERVVNCTESFVGGTCATVGPVVQCVVPVGEHCIQSSEEQGTFIARCAGFESGCVGYAPETATCEENRGKCQPNQLNTCRGNDLIVGCVNNQARMWDCEELSGTCESGACRGLPIGTVCDDPTTTVPRLVCATGLYCERPVGQPTGTCQPL